MKLEIDLTLPVFRLPFTVPMATGVLCDRKTVTRRMWQFGRVLPKPGQRIAGTENFRAYQYANNLVGVNYKAGPAGHGYGSGGLLELETEPGEAAAWVGTEGRWKPAMFMPAFFSRLPLICVSAERCLLGAGMNEADAIREGVYASGTKWAFSDTPEGSGYDSPMLAFIALWDFVNGPGAWHRDQHLNVVRIQFERNETPWLTGKKEAS